MATLPRVASTGLALACALGASVARAQAVPPLSLSTGALDFGDVYVGTSQSRVVWLQSASASAVVVTAITACDQTSPAFWWSGAPFTVNPGGSRPVSVQYTAPQLPSQDGGCLLVSTDPAGPALRIDLSATATSDPVLVGATSLDAGRVFVGGSRIAQHVLANPTATDMLATVEPCAGGSPAFTVLDRQLTIPARAGASVRVRYAPTAVGVDSGCFVATVPGARRSPLTVSLSGTGVVPGAVLSLSSRDLQFGNVPVGTTEVRTLTVTNSGTADLVVSGLSVCENSDPQYAFAAGGFTLAPGAAKAVALTLTPTAEGQPYGCVAIASNDPLLPVDRVRLHGVSATYAPDLLVSPSPLDFGAVPLGATVTGYIRVENASTSDFPPAAAQLCPGATPDFRVDFADLTLAAGASATVTVHYTPSTPGPVQGCVEAYSEGAGWFFLSVRGTGVGRPAMSVTPPVYDFGTVVLGQTATASVTVGNPGTALLWYSMSACPGSPFVFPALAYDLAPGASRAHPFSFVPRAPGSLSGYCLQFASGDAGVVRVPFVGTVVAPPALALEPPALDFGDVRVGAQATSRVTVSNRGGSSLVVTSVAPCAGSSPAFSVAGPTSFAVAPGLGPTFTVSYTPTGRTSDVGCYAFASNDPAHPVQNVTLGGRGILPPTVSVAPAPLEFGDLDVGTTAVKEVTVTNTGDQPLVVSGIAPCPGATADFSAPADGFTLAPGAAQVVPVTFAPGSWNVLTGCWMIGSDDPVNPSFWFWATGQGHAPRIAADPVTLDFGVLRRNQRKVLTVTVMSAGDRDLVVSRVARCAGTSREFSLEDDGFRLPPGSARTVAITYRPDGHGADVGCVELPSNDPSQPKLTVTVSGAGR